MNKRRRYKAKRRYRWLRRRQRIRDLKCHVVRACTAALAALIAKHAPRDSTDAV